MQKAIEEAKKFVCTTKDRIVKDAKDFVSNVDWDKVAQGAMVVAGGALVIAVGVGAIVSTGGLAAPAIAGLLAGSITTTNVMVAGTLAAGVVATGFGASDVIEGIQHLGINEYTWKFPEIIEVINILSKSNFKILGGDVYSFDNNTIRVTYDNWFCSSNSQEESISYSLKYINKYHNNNGNNYIYSIVVKE